MACEVIWGRALRTKQPCPSFQQLQGYPLKHCHPDAKYAMTFELEHEHFLTAEERKWKEITIAMQYSIWPMYSTATSSIPNLEFNTSVRSSSIVGQIQPTKCFTGSHERKRQVSGNNTGPTIQPRSTLKSRLRT